MKKIKYIFVALLIAILAISLPNCKKEFFTENNINDARNEVETTRIEPKEIEIFDEDITYEVTYVNNGEVMPYALLNPSSVAPDETMPLIVWLHGLGEVNCSENQFLKKGPVAIIPEWELTNVNAYILCPHLKGKFNAGAWSNQGVAGYLSTLLDDFIANHNIDKDKIIVMGASLGGQGAVYMSVKLSEYFEKVVVLSGYPSNAQCSDIEIPAIGYIGTKGRGEDPNSIDFMNRYFAKSVGEENLIVLDSSHGKLPYNVLTLDRDENEKSDIFEWMLSDNYEMIR